MKLAFMAFYIVFSGISAVARAEVSTTLKFPLRCVRYFDDRPLSPETLTVIFESLPNAKLRMTSYINYRRVDTEDDWEMGRLPNGKIAIRGSVMLEGLDVDEETGRGIFWSGFGEAVQCDGVK